MTGRYNYRTGVVDTRRPLLDARHIKSCSKSCEPSAIAGIFGRVKTFGDNYPLLMDQTSKHSSSKAGIGPSDPPGSSAPSDPSRQGHQRTTTLVTSSATPRLDPIGKNKGRPVLLLHAKFNCRTARRSAEKYHDIYRTRSARRRRCSASGKVSLIRPPDLQHDANIDDNLGRLLKLNEWGLTEERSSSSHKQ